MSKTAKIQGDRKYFDTRLRDTRNILHEQCGLQIMLLCPKTISFDETQPTTIAIETWVRNIVNIYKIAAWPEIQYQSRKQLVIFHVCCVSNIGSVHSGTGHTEIRIPILFNASISYATRPPQCPKHELFCITKHAGYLVRAAYCKTS